MTTLKSSALVEEICGRSAANEKVHYIEYLRR